MWCLALDFGCIVYKPHQPTRSSRFYTDVNPNMAIRRQARLCMCLAVLLDRFDLATLQRLSNRNHNSDQSLYWVHNRQIYLSQKTDEIYVSSGWFMGGG